MCFRFAVVRHEARAPLPSDFVSDADCALMIGVVGVYERQDGTRVPEDRASQSSSKMACLLRAPGARPPPCAAPASLNIGCFSVKAGGALVDAERFTRNARLGTKRRPLRRTLGSWPERIRRHTVATESPKALPASSTVTNTPDDMRHKSIGGLSSCQIN